MTGFMIERNLVMLACAVSAGSHAALTREHFAEGLGPGGGFLAATLSLGVLRFGLAHRPDCFALLVAVALVLIGLIGSYALATTTGIPSRSSASRSTSWCGEPCSSAPSTVACSGV